MADTETDKRLMTLQDHFRELMAACPSEFTGRQRVLTEVRGDYVYVQILSTFRLPVSSAKRQAPRRIMN